MIEYREIAEVEYIGTVINGAREYIFQNDLGQLYAIDILDVESPVLPGIRGKIYYKSSLSYGKHIFKVD